MDRAVQPLLLSPERLSPTDPELLLLLLLRNVRALLQQLDPAIAAAAGWSAHAPEEGQAAFHFPFPLK
jgi:hypothetical protein